MVRAGIIPASPVIAATAAACWTSSAVDIFSDTMRAASAPADALPLESNARRKLITCCASKLACQAFNDRCSQENRFLDI